MRYLFVCGLCIADSQRSCSASIHYRCLWLQGLPPTYSHGFSGSPLPPWGSQVRPCLSESPLPGAKIDLRPRAEPVREDRRTPSPAPLSNDGIKQNGHPHVAISLQLQASKLPRHCGASLSLWPHLGFSGSPLPLRVLGFTLTHGPGVPFRGFPLLAAVPRPWRLSVPQ